MNSLGKQEDKVDLAWFPKAHSMQVILITLWLKAWENASWIEDQNHHITPMNLKTIQHKTKAVYEKENDREMNVKWLAELFLQVDTHQWSWPKEGEEEEQTSHFWQFLS